VWPERGREFVDHLFLGQAASHWPAPDETQGKKATTTKNTKTPRRRTTKDSTPHRWPRLRRSLAADRRAPPPSRVTSSALLPPSCSARRLAVADKATPPHWRQVTKSTKVRYYLWWHYVLFVFVCCFIAPRASFLVFTKKSSAYALDGGEGTLTLARSIARCRLIHQKSEREKAEERRRRQDGRDEPKRGRGG
jgi:hypothetical protein